MTTTVKGSTVYFETEVLEALKAKASASNNSLSSLVNEAVRWFLTEDEQDLAAFAERENEPTLSYEDLLADLKQHGKL